MQLAEMCREATFKAGEGLWRPGEPSEKLYLLVSGEAAFEGRQERLLQKTALNLWQCLAGTGHPAICRCLTDCTVLILSTEELQDLLAGEPEFSLALLKYLARQSLEHPA